MKIILLEKVRNLGVLGDVVNVKNGYSRNFLIPQGKAKPATKENLAEFEQRRAELEKIANDKLQAAKDRAEKINYIAVEISARVHDEGKLFGSIGAKEIAQAVTEKGVTVEKREVILPEGPLHEIGEYTVNLMLHSDIIVPLKITIVAQE